MDMINANNAMFLVLSWLCCAIFFFQFLHSVSFWTFFHLNSTLRPDYRIWSRYIHVTVRSQVVSSEFGI